MARWNKDKKVLDHEHTQFWKFDLKDIRDEIVGIFRVDIRFEDWVKRAEDIAEATQIALRGEYDSKSKSDRWL